jgi:ATP adenylyltransferase
LRFSIGFILMPASTFVDLDNARVQEQRQVMQQIIDADHCPFCLENLEEYHKVPILKMGQYWFVTHNQWPYQHTKIHLLIILKEHKEDLSELDPAVGQELLELAKWGQQEFHIPGGGLSLRFGETDYSAATVKHLHAQLIQPDIYHPNYETAPVRVKLGKVLAKQK